VKHFLQFFIPPNYLKKKKQIHNTDLRNGKDDIHIECFSGSSWRTVSKASRKVEFMHWV